MRLVVTRPQPQAAQWVDALHAAGVDAVALPLIATVPAEDGAAIQAAWATLGGHDLVMFVSPNAVSHFFAERPALIEWPATVRAATPGPGSARMLLAAGVPLIVQPAADAAQFDSEALWQVLRDEPWQGRRVLVVRGDGGRDWFADQLRAAGAEVHFVQAYRRTVPTLDAEQQALLAAARGEPATHLWHFSSSQSIDHLERLAPGADWSAAQALASHPRIAERARRLGIPHVRTVAPAVGAVVEAFRTTLQCPRP